MNKSFIKSLRAGLVLVSVLGTSASALAEQVKMMTDPMAKKAGLQGASGMAEVNSEKGTVDISVTLAAGTSLPQGSVLEGWLSTAGRKGGPGMSSASERDQKYGPAFGKEAVAKQSRDLPYALSTGVLKSNDNGRTYTGRFQIDNVLTPYAAVAVTVESDGNTGNYDPRPGSPLMAGMIKEGTMKGEMKRGQ